MEEEEIVSSVSFLPFIVGKSMSVSSLAGFFIMNLARIAPQSLTFLLLGRVWKRVLLTDSHPAEKEVTCRTGRFLRLLAAYRSACWVLCVVQLAWWCGYCKRLNIITLLSTQSGYWRSLTCVQVDIWCWQIGINERSQLIRLLAS